ncbi:MAG: hypothetical protein N3A38_05585, partial [Planctomycetota bacterium]|nr:hypothetical protein [Planctomycetota bacterium]
MDIVHRDGTGHVALELCGKSKRDALGIRVALLLAALAPAVSAGAPVGAGDGPGGSDAAGLAERLERVEKRLERIERMLEQIYGARMRAEAPFREDPGLVAAVERIERSGAA